MYAVIETGGKQYRVCEGDIIFVEKLPVDADAVVEFDRVVMLGKEDGAVVGKPTVEGAKVTGRVLKNGKAKKITVFTYRAKKTPNASWATGSPIQGRDHLDRLIRLQGEEHRWHIKGRRLFENGRDSKSKRLGVKRADGRLCWPAIFWCASGRPHPPWQRRGHRLDDTLFALVDGTVQFERWGRPQAGRLRGKLKRRNESE